MYCTPLRIYVIRKRSIKANAHRDPYDFMHWQVTSEKTIFSSQIFDQINLFFFPGYLLKLWCGEQIVWPDRNLLRISHLHIKKIWKKVMQTQWNILSDECLLYILEKYLKLLRAFIEVYIVYSQKDSNFALSVITNSTITLW